MSYELPDILLQSSGTCQGIGICLPADPAIANTSGGSIRRSPQSCDVHLIGFEYQEPKFDKIPQQIQEFLSELEYKDILLFATSPVRTDENLRVQIERSMVPFLPKNCKYHGLFLCQGEVYLTVIEDLLRQTEEKPECEDEKLLLREYRKGKGHPNREDIRKGWRFIDKEFQLNHL